MGTVADRVAKLEQVSESYLQQVEAAFVLMNAFASGETMKQWSIVDPQAVLGEVYFKLAVHFDEFKSVVRNGA